MATSTKNIKKLLNRFCAMAAIKAIKLMASGALLIRNIRVYA